METKIIKVALPSGHEYCDDAELYTQGEAIEGNPLVFAYYYGSGSYEGMGQAIYQCADGKWDQCGLGHCSCYGPLDGGVGAIGIHESLDALVATFSEELKKENQGIIDALKEQGCK